MTDRQQFLKRTIEEAPFQISFDKNQLKCKKIQTVAHDMEFFMCEQICPGSLPLIANRAI